MTNMSQTYVAVDLLTELCFDAKTNSTDVICRLGKRPRYYRIYKGEFIRAIKRNWDYYSDLSPDKQIMEIMLVLIVTKWLKE